MQNKATAEHHFAISRSFIPIFKISLTFVFSFLHNSRSPYYPSGLLVVHWWSNCDPLVS